MSLKWVLSLAAVGGFIGFIVYLNTLPAGPEAPKQAAPAQQQASPAATKARQDAARQKEQNFRFYEMLPESEVVPPKVQEYTPGPGQNGVRLHPPVRLLPTARKTLSGSAPKSPSRASAPTFNGSTLDNGGIWYRVNVGPFTSRSQMNSAVDKLVSINIQPLVRKVPKEG